MSHALTIFNDKMGQFIIKSTIQSPYYKDHLLDELVQDDREASIIMVALDWLVLGTRYYLVLIIREEVAPPRWESTSL
jgi:hypothetical protein